MFGGSFAPLGALFLCPDTMPAATTPGIGEPAQPDPPKAPEKIEKSGPQAAQQIHYIKSARPPSIVNTRQRHKSVFRTTLTR